MTRFATVATLALTFWLGASTTASADILQFNARVQAGLASGQGMAGGQQENAFHEGAKGVSYGAAVGVEFLLIDGWIEHNQYQNDAGLVGTWTQFMVGLDKRFDIGAKKGRSVDGSGEESGGYSSMYAEVGLGVGFGVGTGQQVVLPLDNSQVTDKGFLGQAHLALGYRLTRSLSMGLMVPVQGAYMFKSGPGVVANDEGTHYQSLQGSLMFNVRVDISVK